MGVKLFILYSSIGVGFNATLNYANQLRIRITHFTHTHYAFYALRKFHIVYCSVIHVAISGGDRSRKDSFIIFLISVHLFAKSLRRVYIGICEDHVLYGSFIRVVVEM